MKFVVCKCFHFGQGQNLVNSVSMGCAFRLIFAIIPNIPNMSLVAKSV